MEYFVIPITALIVSLLTLFSGFGLGVILMPAFALFFPVPLAIAATAVVHLVNNIFKKELIELKADWTVVIRFAPAAIMAAILGAWLLGWLSWMPSIASYHIGKQTHALTPVKLVIGVVIIFFAMFNLTPRLKQIAFGRKYLPLGGIISGFFGGLSGGQGTLRPAFLTKAGIDAKAFDGTNAVCGFVVDIARLIVYGASFRATNFALIPENLRLPVLFAMLFAFIGVFFGSRLMKKVTIPTVKYIVGIMLVLVGTGLMSGLL